MYCDTRELEFTWYKYIIASATPRLDHLRRRGLLWTKPAATNDYNRPDPYSQSFHHCVTCGDQLVHCLTTAGYQTSPALPINGRSSSDNNSAAVNINRSIATLIRRDYVREEPASSLWDHLSTLCHRMCSGISKRFTLDEHARDDLVTDAYILLMSKIKHHKLRYAPGRAPVFSLLTTTIYRLMCSILSKNTRQRTRQAEVVAHLRTRYDQMLQRHG